MDRGSSQLSAGMVGAGGLHNIIMMLLPGIITLKTIKRACIESMWPRELCSVGWGLGLAMVDLQSFVMMANTLSESISLGINLFIFQIA